MGAPFEVKSPRADRGRAEQVGTLTYCKRAAVQPPTPRSLQPSVPAEYGKAPKSEAQRRRFRLTGDP